MHLFFVSFRSEYLGVTIVLQVIEGWKGLLHYICAFHGRPKGQDICEG